MTASSLPKVAIQDANILIDMIDIDVLALMLDLPMEFHVSDFVHAELTEQVYRQAVNEAIADSRLVLDTFDGRDVSEITDMALEMTGLSFPDCSCISLANKLQAALLTGDMRLRREARARDLEVHGSIWIIEQLYLAGRLEAHDAGTRLLSLLHVNPRLPRVTCALKIEEWRSVTPAEAHALIASAIDPNPDRSTQKQSSLPPCRGAGK